MESKISLLRQQRLLGAGERLTELENLFMKYFHLLIKLERECVMS